ncbi:hypothetical protein BGZ65_007598, partial [Modicella reniformis]
MSLQVNFTTHGQALQEAYNAILQPADTKGGDNWALFGYDKGTNDLKVLGRGSGGLEELEEEFMDGKIQYAFVRVADPYSQLNKFVLIGWCGDGVPESKKGLFNNHFGDISKFLKGYHLQISARCEADVAPAQIMKRIEEGSGSKYSIHRENYVPDKITPLQPAYKKTVIPDIAAMQRNPTKPEPAPKYGIGVTKPTTPASSSTPSVPSSNTSTTERSWKTSVGPSYTASTASTSFNKVAPPTSLTNYRSTTTPNDPNMNKAQQIRLEREAREKEERERIKREIEAKDTKEREPQGQLQAQQAAEEERQRELEQQRELQRSQDRAREERTSREREERERAESANAARSAREAATARGEAQAHERAAQEDERKRQQEKQEQRQREEDEAKQQRRLKEVEQRRLQEEEEEQRHLQEQAKAEEEHTQQEAASSQKVDHKVVGAQGSVSALVLYAYEKAEANEMSLIEGEVVVNVTELDVGWWSGESVDGTRSGLFPANYVEVIDQSQEQAAPTATHRADHTGHATAGEGQSGKPTAVA